MRQDEDILSFNSLSDSHWCRGSPASTWGRCLSILYQILTSYPECPTCGVFVNFQFSIRFSPGPTGPEPFLKSGLSILYQILTALTAITINSSSLTFNSLSDSHGVEGRRIREFMLRTFNSLSDSHRRGRWEALLHAPLIFQFSIRFSLQAVPYGGLIFSVPFNSLSDSHVAGEA